MAFCVFSGAVLSNLTTAGISPAAPDVRAGPVGAETAVAEAASAGAAARDVPPASVLADCWPSPWSAVATDSHTLLFSSSRAAVRGSIARGSPISPSAEAAELRTGQEGSLRAPISGSTAWESPMSPSVAVAARRTVSFPSFRAAIRGSTARVPIVQSAWRAAVSTNKFFVAAMRGSIARGSPILPSAFRQARSDPSRGPQGRR